MTTGILESFFLFSWRQNHELENANKRICSVIPFCIKQANSTAAVDPYLIAPSASLHYATRTFVTGGLRRD